ncbi:hypothetical protein PZE06_05495 [Robertmurraya sp. DFI.2.37]|uniref:hypothetical protein n=1 Tax=Robertmurraya TaxID=2837507 RepID=UPI0010F4481A|nr:MULTISPECIES: hypothetical protein [Robertmurraya]MDF1507635.1 hypothetical protein [Robertmurraya sp. DFI.2.37]
MAQKKDWTEEYLVELVKYNSMLKEIPLESRIQRIEVLSKQLVLIGKLAAEFSERYKKIYATRKRVYAEAEIAAPKNKQAHAELAVTELREEEAQAYGNMKRWSNAFESTKEEINALKYKVKIDIEDGSSRRGS